MSEQILLLNPRRAPKRRRNKRRARRGRGLPAGLRRWMAARRATNPRRRKRRHSRRRAVVARRANPRRRVMRVGRHYRARARRHNRRRHVAHRRRRHNPRSFRLPGFSMKGIAGAYVMPIALGSVGGIALNLAWSKLAPKLPTSVQGGWAAVGVKSIFAIAAVMMLGRFLPRYRRQLQMAGVGAVFLSAAPPLMSLISSKVPGLSGYIDYQSYAMPGARLHGYMASRTLGSLEDLYSPAAVIQPPGTAVPRQFGALSGYIAVQPHMGGGSGLMGYDWQNDGM